MTRDLQIPGQVAPVAGYFGRIPKRRTPLPAIARIAASANWPCRFDDEYHIISDFCVGTFGEVIAC